MACKNCNLVKCGCADSYLTTPPPCPTPEDCPDVQPCSEVFDSQCVVYTGDDIVCDPDTVVAQNTTVHDALNDIVDYFCANSGTVPLKEIFYEENVNLINLVDPINWPGGVLNPDIYFFPLTYETLTYTNTSGQAKTYKVHASWDTTWLPLTANNSELANWVDGAIVRTVGAVDTVEYESLNFGALSVYLFDGPNGTDIINIESIPDTVNTTPGDNPVEVRFFQGSIQSNANIFKLITLQDGETISLKFKSKTDSVGWLRRAQLMVEEF